VFGFFVLGFGSWLCLRNYSLTSDKKQGGYYASKKATRVFLVVTYLVLLSVPSVLLVSCGGGGGGGSDGDAVVSAPTVSQASPEANSTNIPVTTTVSVALYDQNAAQLIPVVPPQFFTAAYTVARWSTTTSQFESIAASGDSGYWFNLSHYLSITPSILRFVVQPWPSFPFNYHVNYPAQTPLTPVTSALIVRQAARR
jgi:hypothetical protein